VEDVLPLLIPIFALAIPIAAIVMNGLHKISRLRVEEARARSGLGESGESSRIEALEAEVAELRQELSEVQERVDFAERALVQNRDRQRLPESSD
jgi:predicted RNase H-like nuclease (RuvC/YqgF family)